jgi:arylsulfatase A-like enzyme
MSNHIPLAAMWPRGIAKPGRIVDDFVSFIDFAPTFIEVAGLTWEQSGMAESPGRSLTDIFRSEKSGFVNPARNHVLIGKERTDIGRPNDAGYPIRGIIKDGWLYLKNFEPARWPAGNPETGYLDCDAGATKTFILNARRANPADPFWALCFGMRPPEELYDLANDPDCVRNLAALATEKRTTMSAALTGKLQAQGDPRIIGDGGIFDRYEHANKGHVGFYERFMRGEKPKTGWVKESDYEPAPIPPNPLP